MPRSSGDLRRSCKEGKKIIITTVQKFPFILDEIGDEHRKRKFAIIIDEAHSSQGGRHAAKMNMALLENRALRRRRRKRPRGQDQPDHGRPEDADQRQLLRLHRHPQEQDAGDFRRAGPEDGKVKHRPFHSYTMKQAIQEGFILDVLARLHAGGELLPLMKTVEDDPLFDTKRPRKSCAAMWSRTTTRSARRPRSWWTISTTR
jgi:type I restriction enzyme, R subunit